MQKQSNKQSKNTITTIINLILFIMTPQEQANYLIKTFSDLYSDHFEVDETDVIKQCALRCVENILILLEDSLDVFVHDTELELSNTSFLFWHEVHTIIQNS